MKKIITIFCIMLAPGAATTHAQLKVVESGQVQIGNTEIPVFNPNVAGSVHVTLDSLATLVINGPYDLRSGGYISFGDRHDVSIGQSEYNSRYYKSCMMLLRGDGGIRYNCGDQTIFSYDINTPNIYTGDATMSFYKTVSAPQYLTTSDANSKTDISALENAGEGVKNLIPVSYRLKNNSSDSDSDSKESKAKSTTSGSNLQYGFLAQDVRKVYPDLVYEDAEGNLSIDYTGFIPILVDAIQSLQSRIEEQDEIIESLSGNTRDKKKAGIDAMESNVQKASLSQNNPNPFREATTIECVVPEGSLDAFICVYDLNGHQILKQSITERGNTSVNMEGSSLSAGMYIYTLIIDGVEIDSKRMILTD